MVRLYGDRPAVIAGNDRLTYTELNRAANRVARAILGKARPRQRTDRSVTGNRR